MPLSVTKRDIVFLLLSTLMVIIYVVMAGGWGFPLDDSWIHQTYGRNLALHGEWAFILGQPSAASTSPLYTVVLAIGYLFRIPYTIWAHGMGILTLTITASLASRSAKYIFPESNAVGWWVGLAMIGTWHLIWAAASGMETMMFSMFIVILIYWAWRETDETLVNKVQPLFVRGAIFGVATALTALARPEGIVLGGIAAILMLLVRPQGSFKNVIIYGVGAAIGFVVVISPYLWLNYQLTGGLLPNTANAKFEQHAYILDDYTYLQRYSNLLISIMAGGQLLLIFGVLAFVWKQLRNDQKLTGLYFLLPLIWTFTHISIYAARLPAWYQHGRYVMPTLPALILTGVLGVIYLSQNMSKRHSQSTIKKLQRIAIQTFAISTIVAYIAFLPVGANAYVTDVRVINSEMVASAEYIKNNIPEEELMAIHDIGAVGYFAPRDMIDIAGLVTPEIIPIVDDSNALWQYMEDNGAQYLMAFPDQIPNQNPDDPRLCRIFYADSDATREILGEGFSMAIFRLDYSATCDD